jgi:hypothetical protein
MTFGNYSSLDYVFILNDLNIHRKPKQDKKEKEFLDLIDSYDTRFIYLSSSTRNKSKRLKKVILEHAIDNKIVENNNKSRSKCEINTVYKCSDKLYKCMFGSIFSFQYCNMLAFGGNEYFHCHDNEFEKTDDYPTAKDYINILNNIEKFININGSETINNVSFNFVISNVYPSDILESVNYGKENIMQYKKDSNYTYNERCLNSVHKIINYSLWYATKYNYPGNTYLHVTRNLSSRIDEIDSCKLHNV